MKTRGATVLAAAWLFAVAGSEALAATLLYDDNFDGFPGVDLHGTMPDVGSTAWTAHTGFDADGLITPVSTSGSGAFLPFLPQPGMIYTLAASFRGIAGDGNWFALGYGEAIPANVQTTGNGNRFISDSTTGKAWALIRGSNSANPNQTLRGDANSGTFAAGTMAWSGGPANGGDVDLRIVLNTLGGPGAFTAMFLAKRPTDATYTDIGGGALALNAEDIGMVGVAFSRTNVTGRIASFTLSATPEPASGSLTVAAAVAASWGQRRRRRFLQRMM